ncbi:hypothetical protein [Mycoplasma todarodis]|uniref:NERD domain-containing protein n=1 Tax=Mycoplasma todarodis TaxID=1937191 RepID=A0A4V2NI95_9MOLU|nr:hypothetical protein [Mycoplasma todarodis]TCG11568.1 hypothetical protein C4B25_01140 [Mycoplasma todarodis]
MLTSLNYISVIVWVLIGLVAMLIIGFVVFMFFKNNKGSHENNDEVSSQTNKFIETHLDTGKELLVHNISFKNQFAVKGVSIIPALIIKGKHIFIITNIISVKRADQIIFTGDVPYIVKGRKIKDVKNVDYSWYREIEEYLKWRFGKEYIVEVVCPVQNKSSEIINFENRGVCYSSEIKEYLKNRVEEKPLKKENERASINLFNDVEKLNELNKYA